MSFSISIPMHNGLSPIAIITGYLRRRRPRKPDDFSEFIWWIMETNWITAANVQLKYLRASVPADKRQRPPLFSRHFAQKWSVAVPSISNAEYECERSICGCKIATSHVLCAIGKDSIYTNIKHSHRPYVFRDFIGEFPSVCRIAQMAAPYRFKMLKHNRPRRTQSTHQCGNTKL